MTIEVRRASNDFSDWQAILALLRSAFAYQEERIDPPSSVHALDVESLAKKADDETLIIATDADEIVGCIFARPQPDSLYVSKLAVSPSMQGRGIGTRLMHAVEAMAREISQNTLELNTRIELIENHETFTAMGFVKTGEHAHDGYDRPTFISMQKSLDG